MECDSATATDIDDLAGSCVHWKQGHARVQYRRTVVQPELACGRRRYEPCYLPNTNYVRARWIRSNRAASQPASILPQRHTVVHVSRLLHANGCTANVLRGRPDLLWE